MKIKFFSRCLNEECYHSMQFIVVLQVNYGNNDEMLIVCVSSIMYYHYTFSDAHLIPIVLWNEWKCSVIPL